MRLERGMYRKFLFACNGDERRAQRLFVAFLRTGHEPKFVKSALVDQLRAAGVCLIASVD
jgi:hypothetical protein